MEKTINHQAKLPEFVMGIDVVRQNPLVMFDIGCSGGIHSVFSRFGVDIRAFGFDPALLECERLNGAETRPHVRYYPGFVGVPASHPFFTRRPDPLPHPYFLSWTESTAAWGLQMQMPTDIARNDWPAGEMASLEHKIHIDEFAAGELIDYVDFLKIDTDGADIEVLHSCERLLSNRAVGVVAIEVNFCGGANEWDNTFHATDRFLRRCGMDLINIDVWRYALRQLPLPFRFHGLGETVAGFPCIGDAIYVSSEATKSLGDEAKRAAAVLKQAALAELFGSPDCAARLIIAGRAHLTPRVDPEAVLDVLTPLLDGASVSYRDYIARFEKDVRAFFPK